MADTKIGKAYRIPKLNLADYWIQRNYRKHGTLFVAMLIFKKSQQYVPVDTGNLRDSGKIIPLDDNKYRIIYDAPYAARQHEEIDYQHIEPGRAKFLEDAAYEILNYTADSGDSPLFTFKLIFPGDGAVALDVDTLETEEFIRNKEARDRLLNMTWEGLDGLDS